MKKKLENFKGVVLKQIAKDIKLKGYSALNTEELREALATELTKNHKGFDLSKYEVVPKENGSSEEGSSTEEVDSPNIGALAARRRTVLQKNFGRR